jgi:NADH-quinone oxidoreductase subunit H
METAVLLEVIIKSAILLLAMTGGFAYLTLFERRVLARMQVRIGPNRAGPFGILQPIADGIKLIFKEELIPTRANKLIFVLAPVITVFPALVITAVIPWGGKVVLFGREISLYIADVSVGVIYIAAIASIAVYGITLAGWSSNNKYAMLGGLRATAQMISYELALGLAFVTPMILAGSMRILDIIEAQREYGWLAWLLFQPLAPIIFLISSVAEVNRAPFDMPEAEQELTAGYHTEYSGMKFALFFMAEYIKMIAVSMIGATLFFGGFLGPDLSGLIGETANTLLGPLWLFLKVIVLLFGMIWLRATSPRIRYDRLMAFGWKALLPLALLNVLITSVIIVIRGG